MFSRLSYGMMKHCMQERPLQKSRPNSFIEMGPVNRKPKPSNAPLDANYLNKRYVGI
jgi:hypothetical protein